MKKSLIGIAVAMLVISVFFFMAAYYWLYQDEDSTISIAENALARDGLVFIGHVNIKKIRSLYKIKYGEVDPSPIPALMVDTSMVNALFSGKSPLREKAGQAVFGFRVTEDGGSSMNFILNGKFASEDLKKLLAKNFSIKDQGNGGFIITRLPDEQSITSGEEFDCPEDKDSKTNKKTRLTLALVHSGEWLIVSGNIEDARAILQRIESREKAIVNIDRWKHFRKGKLVSLGIVDPENTRRSPIGMLSMLFPNAKDAKNNKSAYTEAYIGAAINLASRSLLVSSDIISKPAWAKEKADEFAGKKTEFVKSARDFSATLAGLAENVNVTNHGELLQVVVNIPHDLVEKMPEVIREVISGIFSNAFGGKSSSANAKNAKKEKLVDEIDDKPWDYAINNTFSGLQEFSPDQSFLPQQFNGGFGYSLQKVSFSETGLIEVAFESKFNFPQLEKGFWWDAGVQHTLWIKAANDAAGNSLLRDERCVKDLPMFAQKNQSPEKIMNFSNNVGSDNKTFRLVKGASFQALKTISGNVEISLPTMVIRQRIQAKLGEKVEMHGVRIFVSKVEQDGVVLEISGDDKKMVEIRGINQSGKTLKSRGMSSFGMNGMISKHASFAGNLKAVDVFIAKEFKTLKDEFVFDVAAASTSGESKEFKHELLAKPGKVTRAEWHAFNNADANKFNESVVSDWKKSLGNHTRVPIDIRIGHDKDSTWNYIPEFTVTVPFMDRLIANYNFIELVIDSNGHDHPAIAEPFLITPAIHFINDLPQYGYSFKIGDQYFVRDSQGIDLGYKQGEAIDVIGGAVKINLPQSLSEQRFDLPGFDKPSLIGQHSVTLQEIDFGFSDAYKLKYTGPLDHFVSILTVTDSGEIYNALEFKKDKDGVLVHIPILNNISHLILVTADKQDVITYPFSIKMDYSKNEKKQE